MVGQAIECPSCRNRITIPPAPGNLRQGKRFNILMISGVLGLVLVAAVVVLFFCFGGRGRKSPVVGIAECALFANSNLGRPTGKIPTGMKVQVLRAEKSAVEVKYADGSGWVHGYSLCAPDEYERRKAQNEIPERIITIVYMDGSFRLTGGTISIGNDAPVAGPGQAFWMDASTEGRSFTIESTECRRGNFLHLVNRNNIVVHIPVWPVAGSDQPGQ